MSDERETDIVLSREVYDFIESAGSKGCTFSKIFYTEPCGECVGCEAKKLAQKLVNRFAKLDRRPNPFDAMEEMWNAFESIRVICDHSGGRNATARKMRGDFDAIRKIIDRGVTAYSPDGQCP